ncbi:hypothetical protein ALC57_11970, partial [Trachymyrmex cornetzi]
VNLSSIDIPLEVKYLLQLGEKFGLPINKNNKEKTLIEFIKQIENNIIGRPKNIINFVRNNSISILNRFQNNFPSPNFFDKQISNWLHITNKFINNHPNILITNADKGNVTVVLDKDTYITKMEEILSDSNTYEVIARDPIRRLTQDLRALLVRWKRDSYIDDQTYRRLLTTDGVIPRAYGLTKIHKDGNPLRIIVSSINSPLYSLSLFLHNIINRRRNTGSPTVITDHRINLDHNFKWDNVRILDYESSYNKRLVSEMIHIKKQRNKD